MKEVITVIAVAAASIFISNIPVFLGMNEEVRLKLVEQEYLISIGIEEK